MSSALTIIFMLKSVCSSLSIWLVASKSSVLFIDYQIVETSDNTKSNSVFSTAMRINCFLTAVFFFFLIAVIDFCLTRALVCDKETHYQSLRLCWASKESCNQRKGKMTIGNGKEFGTLIFMENSMFLFILLTVKSKIYFCHEQFIQKHNSVLCQNIEMWLNSYAWMSYFVQVLFQRNASVTVKKY